MSNEEITIIPEPQQDPSINLNKIFDAYIELSNTGSTSTTIDRDFLDMVIEYRLFEQYCFFQSKLNVIPKAEFYLVIEGYLSLFCFAQEQEMIPAIQSIIDILNSYCSQTQLKRFHAQLKSDKLKSFIRISEQT